MVGQSADVFEHCLLCAAKRSLACGVFASFSGGSSARHVERGYSRVAGVRKTERNLGSTA